MQVLKEVTADEYRGVWVFAEQGEGRLRAVTLELLGQARVLADSLGVEVTALLLGSGIGHLCGGLISHGADRVLLADHPSLETYLTEPYTTVITTELWRGKPEILLLGATDIGRDLAPRVARRAGTGCTADCTELDVDVEKRLLIQTKPSYGGKMMVSLICPAHRPQMATVRPGIMKAMDQDENRQGEVVPVEVRLEAKDLRVKVIRTVKEAGNASGLDAAKVVVGGGAGMGSAEGFRILHDLASALGGEVGATRDVTDKGWIADSRMIGQTGRTVKPDLYIACGISGADQHVAGVWESGTIVAINKDPKAAIFKIADYGVVGDVQEVIPLLIKAINMHAAGASSN